MAVQAPQVPYPDSFAPTTLPAYVPGTTFVYSDGTWEPVVEATPEMVTWTDQNGAVSIGFSDFTVPKTYWGNRKGAGIRYFDKREDIFFGGVDSLWPLHKGKGVDYSEKVHWEGNDGGRRTYGSRWTCKVVRTERVAVLAGEFDSWKIMCGPHPLSPSIRTGPPKEELSSLRSQLE